MDGAKDLMELLLQRVHSCDPSLLRSLQIGIATMPLVGGAVDGATIFLAVAKYKMSIEVRYSYRIHFEKQKIQLWKNQCYFEVRGTQYPS